MKQYKVTLLKKGCNRQFIAYASSKSELLKKIYDKWLFFDVDIEEISGYTGGLEVINL